MTVATYRLLQYPRNLPDAELLAVVADATGDAPNANIFGNILDGTLLAQIAEAIGDAPTAVIRGSVPPEPNPCKQLGLTEFWEYITPDGVHYELPVMTDEGTGMPPFEYLTQRGPFQHGETVLHTTMRPRVVQFLIRENAVSRPQYYSKRAKILDILRPNRSITYTVPGVLRKWFPDGQRRDLDCFIQSGPAFSPRSLTQWDEWSFQEVIRFIGYNPVISNPDGHQLITYTDPDLVFPITFPIVFGGLDALFTINYVGSWIEYPTFVLQGPMVRPHIFHQDLGDSILLNYNIAAGETVTIALKAYSKTITSSLYGNIPGSVGVDSNLQTFHIATDGELAGGVNNIRVYASETDSNSNALISWNDRYVGF